MKHETLQLAGDGKFSEFEAAVKTVLRNKLGNHEEIKSYTSAFDKIQDMKNLFKQINTPVVPAAPSTPTVETPKVDAVPEPTSNPETVTQNEEINDVAPTDIKEENLKTDGE